MSDPSSESSDYRGPAVFSYGFRPFFLGAALFAGVVIPVWILVYAGVGHSGFLYPARDWHVHEMVFGFLPAVITGFMLTAIPNWTDRSPIRGTALMVSVRLVAGRASRHGNLLDHTHHVRRRRCGLSGRGGGIRLARNCGGSKLEPCADGRADQSVWRRQHRVPRAGF